MVLIAKDISKIKIYSRNIILLLFFILLRHLL